MTILVPKYNSPDSFFEDLLKNRTTPIGSGTSRAVYEIPEHDDKVLKVSNLESNFSNWSEIVAYQHNREDGKLAEILSWSWTGKYIVMERLTPLQAGEMSEYSFPAYLTDRKPKNLGRNKDGIIKALDYALLKFPSLYESKFL